MSVDIAADALKFGRDTGIALGDLRAQSDYRTFVPKDYITKELAMK